MRYPVGPAVVRGKGDNYCMKIISKNPLSCAIPFLRTGPGSKWSSYTLLQCSCPHPKQYNTNPKPWNTWYHVAGLPVLRGQCTCISPRLIWFYVPSAQISRSNPEPHGRSIVGVAPVARPYNNDPSFNSVFHQSNFGAVCRESSTGFSVVLCLLEECSSSIGFRWGLLLDV